MKILLLSAYDAASHRVWREGLVRHLDEHEWTVLTLPPRFFAWRSRGNPLSWVFGEREILESKYDLIVATSMTNLAALKGIVPPLAATPVIAYFHENQFAYPEQHERKEYQNYKFTNLYTALAADRVLFNSRYNMDTFLDGAGELLSIMPDHVPTGIVEAVKDRSEVLPVPLEGALYTGGSGRSGGPLEIMWNHRWEYDKAPERFFGALYGIREKNIPFKVHVVGQQFRDHPQVFQKAREKLGDCVQSWGFVKDERDYRSILSSADLVVSTALHDFQGLAVLEGVAAGCLPLVPDRLAYRELFPESFRYPSRAEDPEGEMNVLAQYLEELCRNPETTRQMEPPDLRYLSWEDMAEKYRNVLKEVARI
jgi:glycosyltransferase involved in cell wall biosynthesis